MACPERYSILLLSLFMDGELAVKDGVETHLGNCPFCSSWISRIQRQEQEIQTYEKYQQNSILLEFFDVPNQCRRTQELGWDPVFVGFNAQGELNLLSSISNHRLRFYLKYFWYGQLGIYVENLEFPLGVFLQRSKRYIPVLAHQSQRLIANDGLLLMDAGAPVFKITLNIPQQFQEHSITRKYTRLAAGSACFISQFFKDAPMDISAIAVWCQIKKSMSIRDIGVYLLHLNSQLSYRAVARKLQVSPAHVTNLIRDIRKKLSKMAE